MSATETRAACLSNWPDAENGAYHPSCCRFPKSCSVPSLPVTDPTPADPTNQKGTP